MDYSVLKSGSDIRGIADSSLSGIVNLDKRATCTIVDAFVYWLSQKKQKPKLKIAFGFDSRNTSKEIGTWVVIALQYAGCDILDCGLASTPAMFMMTALPDIECDGAIMITASHLPKDRNGLKFFTRDGGLSSDEISIVLEYANDEKSNEQKGTTYNKKDYMGLYCDYLIKRVRAISGLDRPYEGLKVVLDASNGVGGFFASKVLNVLGADTTGSQFLEPNGEFPNHIPNPEDKQAMMSISKCVIDNSADIGIIFDTDADRVAVVDREGNIINRNNLIALISAILLKAEPQGYIITDSITSSGLTDFIYKIGGRHHRYKRGYQNVIGEAKKFLSNNMNCLIAIETSGHAALKENYFLDDGAYLALRIIIALAELKKENKDLKDLIADLKQPLEEKEARVKISATDFVNFGNNVIKSMTEWAKMEYVLDGVSYEGVRVKVPKFDGWFLARMSLHDPVMPINIESNQVGGVKKIADLLYQKLSLLQELDATTLIM